MSSLWFELQRRNVIRVGILYAVSGWILLQVAETLFGLLNVPSWALRLVLGLLLLGFPLVLIFSWVFEMTPEGLKRESEIDHARSIAPNTGRKIDRLIIIGLGAIVLILVADRVRFMSSPQQATQPATTIAAKAAAGPAADGDLAGGAEQKSIAVLPFAEESCCRWRLRL